MSEPDARVRNPAGSAPLLGDMGRMNGWLQRQAAEASCKLQAASDMRQATSDKQKQAGSWKLEAGSWKLEAKSLCLRLRKEQDLTACCAADSDLQLGQHPMAAWLPHQTQAFGFWLLAFGFWLLALSLRLAACCLLLSGQKNAPLRARFSDTASRFDQPHLLSPQARQVRQPSIWIAALVWHLPHICEPSG